MITQEQLQKLWVRFSFITCHKHIGLDLKSTPGLAWIPSPHCLCQTQLLGWGQIFGGSWFQGGLWGCSIPSLVHWFPPGAQPLLGCQVPAAHVLGLYFIPINVYLYLHKLYFPLSKAMVNLNSERHLRRWKRQGSTEEDRKVGTKVHTNILKYQNTPSRSQHTSWA